MLRTGYRSCGFAAAAAAAAAVVVAAVVVVVVVVVVVEGAGDGGVLPTTKLPTSDSAAVGADSCW